MIQTQNLSVDRSEMQVNRVRSCRWNHVLCLERVMYPPVAGSMIFFLPSSLVKDSVKQDSGAVSAE